VGAAPARWGTRDPIRRSRDRRPDSRDPAQPIVASRDRADRVVRRSRASGARTRDRATPAHDTVPTAFLPLRGTRATGDGASAAMPDTHYTGVPTPHAVPLSHNLRPRSRDATPASGYSDRPPSGA